ncbi:PDZ domain-containing secreted protein [Streptomyces sp. TE4109]
MLPRLSRPRALALCALPVLALFGVAAFAPLPFTLAQPGSTANVLGNDHGKPVISIKGAPTRPHRG